LKTAVNHLIFEATERLAPRMTTSTRTLKVVAVVAIVATGLIHLWTARDSGEATYKGGRRLLLPILRHPRNTLVANRRDALLRLA
jgi:hypothetical protein